MNVLSLAPRYCRKYILKEGRYKSDDFGNLGTDFLKDVPYHQKFGYSWFQAAGIAVMSVGIFARVSASNYSGLMDEGGFKSAANILIAAGAMVMIIGAIGCCGVMKEKKWLLLLVITNNRV